MNFEKSIFENRMEKGSPLLAAHRGVCGANVPCNTIAAYKIALKQGADVVEIDVSKSKDGKFYVYGTPFSGKSDLNVTARVPLKGICLLRRDTTNHAEKVSTEEALFEILNQTCRPIDEDRMSKLLDILDALVTTVPIHKLFCNMDPQAALVSYNAMK